MKTFIWLLRFLTPYRSRIALAALLGYLAIATNVGLMGTSGYLIAAAALHPATILLLWTPIVGVRFFGISRSVFRYLERLVSHDVTFRILANVRVWYYRQLESDTGDLLARYQSTDLFTAGVTDVESLQNLYLRVVAPPLVALLVGITSFWLVARQSVTAAVLFGGCYGISGAVVPWLTSRLGSRANRNQIEARTTLQTRLGDVIGGITEILVDGSEQSVMDRLEQDQGKLSRAFQRSRTVESASNGVFVFVTNAAIWLALIALIPLVADNRVAGVEIPSLLFIVLASFEAVMPLPAAMQALTETLFAADRIRRFASDIHDSHEAECQTSGVNFRGPSKDDTVLHEGDMPTLEVRNLSVRYHPDRSEAVNHVSFALMPGQVTAVVGESGSGKSTLMNALLRICPYQGDIYIHGQDSQLLNDAEVRGYFATVTQPAYLFHVSVADNLRLAKPDACETDVERAIETAQLSQVIEKLPDGLDTIVGEDGVRFSGGERQRLALARAVLKEAPILLLDEPTSGLDPQTEMEFLAALFEVVGNKTVLYITHQLNSLDRFDQILVMRDGRLKEQGTFNSLMQESDSHLRQLWELGKQYVE